MNANNASDGPWEPLEKVEDLQAPPFPVDLLPAVLRDYARVVAASAQIHVAAVAVMALGAVATLAQKTARVQGPQWAETLSLFLLAIADVSERKTAAYGHMVGPVHDIEAELDGIGRDARAYANEKRHVLAEQLKRLRSAAASVKGGERPSLDEIAQTRAELEAMGPEERAPRLAVDDATVQALVSLMADNGGRLALLSPEAGFLSVLAGAYSNNGNPADMSALLSAYTGSEPITVDRKGRESERIPRPALTVVMVGQPRVLRDLQKIPGAKERGLLARFVLVQVPSLAGTRRLDVTDRPSPGETAEGKAYLDMLRALSQRAVSDEPPALALTDEALEFYRGWHDALEPERGTDGGRWSPIRDFAGKAHGLALRFAGLFHLLDDPRAPDGALIDEDTMRRGCALADWALAAHEAAVFGAEQAPEVRYTLRLEAAARKGTLGATAANPQPWRVFQPRDVSRHLGNKTHPLTTREAIELLEFMAERHYVRSTPGGWEWHPDLVNGGQ